MRWHRFAERRSTTNSKDVGTLGDWSIAIRYTACVFEVQGTSWRFIGARACILFYGERLEMANSFKYLGKSITTREFVRSNHKSQDPGQLSRTDFSKVRWELRVSNDKVRTIVSWLRKSLYITFSGLDQFRLCLSTIYFLVFCTCWVRLEATRLSIKIKKLASVRHRLAFLAFLTVAQKIRTVYGWRCRETWLNRSQWRQELYAPVCRPCAT